MKKYLTYLAIFLIVVTANSYSQGNVKLWKTLYGQAKTVKQKRDKIKEIEKIATEDFTDLILDILDEQVSYGDENRGFWKRDHEEWLYYTGKIVGRLKISEGAPKLKTLITFLDNSIYIGEMYHDIAKTGNKEMLPWLNSRLGYYNEQHYEGNIKGKEPIVNGLLNAIREFKDPSSFDVVFYAAIPNYAEPLRNLASQVAGEISNNDPANLCTAYIKKEAKNRLRFEAMKYSFNSESAVEDRALSVITAFGRELDNFEEMDVFAKQTKDELEMLAVRYLGELKTTNPEAVTLLEQKWDRDAKVKDISAEDTNRMLDIIESLQKIATEQTSQVLTRKLAYFNYTIAEDFGTGYGEKEGVKILIAMIRALGAIGINSENIINDVSKESTSTVFELEIVRLGGFYEKVIQEEAAAALEKL